MSRIKRIEIKNFIGISEFALDPGKINWLLGHKGSGKTTIVESMEKAFTNKNRRTEVIKHGEDEARIFVQTDDGLEIERKIRLDKADYLKVRKPGENVPSTEAFLRKLINGEIFRPLEFVKKSADEQAKIILNMLDIPWTMDDISAWFSEIPGVNYEAHILQVLKQIETLYYNSRESINREIKVLEAQVAGIRNELPPNYDGEHWREQKVAEYYAKVAQAEEVNKKIVAAQNLIEGLESRIATIKAESEADKQSKKNAFDRQRADIREFKQFVEQKIEKAQAVIDGISESLASAANNIKQELSLDIEKENSEYQRRLQELKEVHETKIATLREDAQMRQGNAEIHFASKEAAAKDEIAKCRNSLAAKDQELLNIDSLEKQSLASLEENTLQKIEAENIKAGNAKSESEKEPIDITPLSEEADKVANMQSFLREYDRMKDIITNKLSPRQEQAQTLTARIQKARELPMELLKIAAVPIPEIAVDGDGRIRIGETLLSDLSEGEQLELAFRVAKAQAGELKVICIDGIDKINEADRKWLEHEMETDDLQYFVLSTQDGDLRVEIKEGA